MNEEKEQNQEIIVCPDCGTPNLKSFKYCIKRTCNHIFTEEEKTDSKQPPKSGVSGGVLVPEDADAPILDFDEKASNLESLIIEEISSCSRKQKKIENLTNTSDDSIRIAYQQYVTNYETMTQALAKVEGWAGKLESSYEKAKTKLANGGSDSSKTALRIKHLTMSFDDRKKNVLKAVTDWVDKYMGINPFTQCKGYQVSPISEWDKSFIHSQLPQRFVYLGTISHNYHVLGREFLISRREYMELLNANNLILHYNNRRIETGLKLVSTMIGRMLKATKGQSLQLCVVDPKSALSLHNTFRGLPEELHVVERDFDTENMLDQEIRIEQMTEGKSLESFNLSRKTDDNLMVYQIVVFKDWYTSLANGIHDDDMEEIVGKGVKTGKCFIFMVNDDNNPAETSLRGHDNEDLLGNFADCLEIDLSNQWLGKNEKLDLMDDDLLLDTIKEIRHFMEEIPLSNTIDAGATLEDLKIWGVSSCQNGVSLSIGMDNQLKNNIIHFGDNSINRSLLVSYRSGESHVIPWINAMIAEAFTKYSSEELNVMVADFTGDAELAALTGNRIINTAPFYFFSVNQSVTKEVVGSRYLPKALSSYKTEDSNKRLLAFVIGGFDDLKRFVISKNYHNRDKVHMVLLTTDVVGGESQRQLNFEGYRISFGPMRLDGRTSRYDKDEGNRQPLSGDEFLMDGSAYQAFSYSNNKTWQILQEFVNLSVLDPKPKLKPALEQQAKAEPEQQAKAEPEQQAKAEPEQQAKAEPEQQAKAEPEQQAVEAEDNTDDIETIDYPDSILDYQKTFFYRDFMLPENEWWHGDCSKTMEVPFGVHINWEKDEKETWSFFFEDKETQKNAALVLGGAGSGKTTFLQTLIISAAQRYSPKDLEFYLIDFKNVGFLPFERYKLPHVRVVAGGADREFGLSILKKLGEEIRYRNSHPEKTFPRIVLIIDECQDFFLGDTIADEATGVIEDIIRRGRSGGINIILATQQLSSPSTSIPSSLYNSIGIRAVARPSDTDYFSLFDRSSSYEYNELCTYKKGELLFVADARMTSENIEDYHAKSFYIEYDEKDMDNSELKSLIEQLAEHAIAHPDQCPSDMGMYKFHNDAPLVAFNNARMKPEHRIVSEQLPKKSYAYLGEPIAIANDLYLTLSMERYQNVLVIGASDAVVGQGVVFNAMLSSLMPYPEGKRIDYVFDFTKNGEPLNGQLTEVVEGAPFNPQSKVVPNKEDAVVEQLRQIKEELDKRIGQSEEAIESHIFITIFGLDRGNMFGIDLENSNYIDVPLESTNLLSEIIKKGPQYGIFTIIQFTGRVELLKEKLADIRYELFNHIITLQMEDNEMVSLTGSIAMQLYDRNLAQNNPGLYRALYFDRTNPSYLLKFKPYKYY